MAPKKKYATEEERKAAKSASKKAYYDRHKHEVEFMAKFNVLNLKRYHTKRQDPKFVDNLNEKRREYYHSRKSQPGLKEARSEKARHAASILPWKGIVRGAIKRAIEKDIPYDADLLEWAPTVWTGRCALSGIEFKRGCGISGPTSLSPSIDRIIPSLGYTKLNCRFILHGLNALKSTGTDEEMEVIIRAMYRTYPA